MMCDNCGKNTANTMIEKNINGKKTRMYLCPECAAKSGALDPFKYGFDGFGMNNILSTMLGSSEEAHEDKCPFCGSTFAEIARHGKAGCAKCYDAFYDRLSATIYRLHGDTVHKGKLPKNAGEKISQKRRLGDLKKQLQKAIEAQEFEQAARLRDEINDLRKGGECDG